MKQRNRLRVLRAEKRITQRDLSLKVRGLSLNRIWLIENGYNDATPEEQERLAKFFGCAVADIFPNPQQEAAK